MSGRRGWRRGRIGLRASRPPLSGARRRRLPERVELPVPPSERKAFPADFPEGLKPRLRLFFSVDLVGSTFAGVYTSGGTMERTGAA